MIPFKNTYIWHPFTQMKTAPAPIHIAYGKGSLLFDANGKSYIDAISSWWTNIHGHAHPYIAQKLYDQAQILEHVIFAGFTHTPAEQLAQRLVENHLPNEINKLFFSDNGSTSVEVAIKMAIQYWQNINQPKKKLIAFHHSYHGDTFGSMSVSERGPFTKPFHDLLFEVEFITPPFLGKENESIEQFQAAIKQKNVAAFIYEPLVMGAGGMLMYAPESLNSLLEIAQENKIICIADEVMTGFYRTGKMFASNYCTITPDIICLSKGLTGGTMALGITACKQFIFDAFYAQDKMLAFYHGHSYTANPLACTAALASLDLFDLKTCKENIQSLIQFLSDFNSELNLLHQIENVRQTGTILAFDIKSNAESNYFNAQREEIYSYFINQNILIRPLGNTIYLMPPYCIDKTQLQEIRNKIIAFLDL